MNRRGQFVALILGSVVAVGLLPACSHSAAGAADAALCADAASVRQLVAEANTGLPEASLLTRIQALEASLTAESITAGVSGDPAAGTSAAHLAVAVGTWKTDLTLAQDVRADEARAAAAAAQIPGCAG
jgi:hypothetical protein